MINVLRDFGKVTEIRDVSGYGIYRLSGRPGELSPEGWRADSDCAGEKTSKAFDRDWLTRWSSAKPQEPGIYYQLDLGRVHNLSEMVLNFAGSRYDYPRGFRLLTSLDGADWEEVETEVKFKPGYLWMGEHLLKASEEPDEVQIVFKRVRARFMKIVLTESDPVYHWSIYEIHVYADKSL